MSTHLAITPRSSEKAYASVEKNVYVFNVPTSLNKRQIAEIVSKDYSVIVVDVNVVVSKGKPVRAYRGKRYTPGKANRSATKKAYVRLAEGNSIKVFDEEEQEEKK